MKKCSGLSTLSPREGSKNCEGERGETAQGNGEELPSAAVSGCLETSCPSTVLTPSAAISFYTAFSPQGLTPGVEGKSRECPHHCHQTSSLMKEGMRSYERSKGRSSRNGPAPRPYPSQRCCQPVCVAHLPCTCQHSVELLMMGPLFTAVFLFKQLEKLKDQLSTEDGPEVAYALESLSASQPKKRGRF